MNFHRDAQQDAYDSIIIGSGIGGLTSAALLATVGKKVLLVERHDRPGGYAHGFSRKQYRFDSGVHLTSGCESQGYRNGQFIHRVLKATGIEDQVEFIPVNPYGRTVFPGLTLDMPQGLEAFITELSRTFPDQATALQELMKTCLALTEEISIANDVMPVSDPATIQAQLPTLFRYRRTTLKSALDDYLSDERLKSLIASLWPYLGLPPSRLSFLYWSIMFIGYTVDGAYYCKGSFQNFANALANGIKAKGGEVLYKTGVRRIEVERKQVKGVILDNGQRIAAPIVISNADMKQTVYSMVGAEHFSPVFIKKLARARPSSSLFVVYIATDLDLTRLGITHESFYFDSFDHEASFTTALSGHANWFSATVPTLIDPSLAPEGEHLIMLTTLVAYDAVPSWKAAKQSYQDKLLDMAETHIPGLKSHLLWVESGTPRTMERYTLNEFGAAYGWEPSPEQIGPNRLGHDSSIDGLYFAGHWSAPGGGVYGVTVSGVQTAQAILGIKTQSEFWQQFD